MSFRHCPHCGQGNADFQEAAALVQGPSPRSGFSKKRPGRFNLDALVEQGYAGLRSVQGWVVEKAGELRAPVEGDDGDAGAVIAVGTLGQEEEQAVAAAAEVSGEPAGDEPAGGEAAAAEAGGEEEEEDEVVPSSTC